MEKKISEYSLIALSFFVLILIGVYFINFTNNG